MDLQGYKDEILLKLGGGVVKVELEDDGLIDKVIQASFREVQRYINTTKLVTLPYHTCMDLSKLKVSSINQVYRVNAIGINTANTNSYTDPIYLSFISSTGTGTMHDMVSNYAAYMIRKQISNTLSTDLTYYWDASTEKLYINAPTPAPQQITIDYIPKYEDVSEITEPFWEDILVRLSLANAKVTLGRIRGKYKLNNALYDLDSDALLQEGNEELSQLREYLQTNSDTVYPID